MHLKIRHTVLSTGRCEIGSLTPNVDLHGFYGKAGDSLLSILEGNHFGQDPLLANPKPLPASVSHVNAKQTQGAVTKTQTLKPSPSFFTLPPDCRHDGIGTFMLSCHSSCPRASHSSFAASFQGCAIDFSRSLAENPPKVTSAVSFP